MSNFHQQAISTSDLSKLQLTSIMSEKKSVCVIKEPSEIDLISDLNPCRVNSTSIWERPKQSISSDTSPNDAFNKPKDLCKQQQQQRRQQQQTSTMRSRPEQRAREFQSLDSACRQQRTATIALLGYAVISVLLCLQPFIVAGTSSQETFSEQEGRSGQWSLPSRPSLFSIIRFPNEECFDSSNQSGTCYTAFECKLLGGQPSSPCAAGFGSCCIVSRTCHVTTREKVVYFKNPSYPSADSDEKFCDLTVEMSDINVCQLRLDFLDFQLDPPTNGACKDDYMEISASGMPPQTVPRLCGLNRNQHCK